MKVRSILAGVIAATALVGLAACGPDTTSASTDSKHEASSSPSKSAAKVTPTKRTKAPQKMDTYGDGDYQVGKDIPAGTYRSSGAKKGIFDLCTVTTKPTSSSTLPQVKTANSGDQVLITLAKEDGVVTFKGCNSFKAR
jgi:cytoskeletal protein RodZ